MLHGNSIKNIVATLALPARRRIIIQSGTIMLLKLKRLFAAGDLIFNGQAHC